MKIKYYVNMDNYLDDENKKETDVAIVERNGKWIDVDCIIEAKTIYLAFKKLATALKNAKYADLSKDLINDMEYKEDFLNCLEIYNQCYPYPDERKNGFYGYSYENCYDDVYYIRYFKPIFN